ncbi:MAG TPA: hypothetical protein VFQ23_20055 [Anaerolineales bacterium]|nr:hypothetical protein [Anaerolineales bacterium]
MDDAGMKKIKILICLIFVIAALGTRVKGVYAAPEALTGTVQSVTLETDTNTATTTVLIELLHNENKQTVRVNLDTAISLGLLTLGGDGNPVINEAILGQLIEIDGATIITDEQENQHPVADALATFFSDIAGLDDETIMSVHDEGTGFGVIAQALWLTRKLDGNAEIFLAIIDAKETRDFSSFVLEDGTTPENWGQFKQAVLNGKRGKPSVTLVNNNGNGGGNGNNGIPHNDNGNGKNNNKNNKENHDQRNNRNNSDR